MSASTQFINPGKKNVGGLYIHWLFLGIPRIIDKMLKGYKQVQKIVVLDRASLGYL